MEEPAATVLYIDDDPALARLVEKDLSRHGYRVEKALAGAEGLVRLRAGGIDVVALDHNMPGETGLDLLPAILAVPDPPPVVYVTGERESRIAVAALKAGAVDYVVKEAYEDFYPLLRAAIAGALEARALRRARERAEAELRASRDRFQALADERALLIHEMNHRVGNSLQLVASLLNMQASASEDPKVRTALGEATSRVMAIAQLHRRLHSHDDVRLIALDQYLASLMDDLARTFDNGAAADRLAFVSEAVEVRADEAVSLGVIVTELVINALKYAYPGDLGPVRVFCRARPGTVEIVVEDDGIGADVTGGKKGGLGRRIIGALAAKLGANVEQDPAHAGTRVMIRVARTSEPAADAA
ncbi:sensor histidine kinase [Prosthecomicrobium pneumaticum]|uniref:histidine kinase n=1 Tax=Prosthecomicrobium pneumaticum TaxID=81895 RepID=A0A7W9L3X9_9HYPH|nr:sensor histidine kinase [Prosthecomicrobium pneumaticum]MBB5755016.1 two-component sensor histidine kinase [Prosthecomicrobium pneumaticum]